MWIEKVHSIKLLGTIRAKLCKNVAILYSFMNFS